MRTRSTRWPVKCIRGANDELLFFRQHSNALLFRLIDIFIYTQVYPCWINVCCSWHRGSSKPSYVSGLSKTCAHAGFNPREMVAPILLIVFTYQLFSLVLSRSYWFHGPRVFVSIKPADKAARGLYSACKSAVCACSVNTHFLSRLIAINIIRLHRGIVYTS